MKKYSYLAFLFFLSLVLSCKGKQQVIQTGIQTPIRLHEQPLIDSILQSALDYEALYTLLGNVKPMSSVRLYRFPLANTDSVKQTSADIVDRKKKDVI